MTDHLAEARRLATQATTASLASAINHLADAIAETRNLTRTEPGHWTDEPRHEVQFGVNPGDPTDVCDPRFITDDEVTAFENARLVSRGVVMRRTTVTIYGPWEPNPHYIDTEAPF